MDRNRYSGTPSTERTVFMDGGQILKVPSTKSRVFVDGTKIIGRKGLSDRIKLVYLSVYERVLFGRSRGGWDCRDAKTRHI